MQLRIECVPLASIKPYENNAKKHPQNQVDQIAASIQVFGNNDPIAIDETGTIIEGHGRFLALQQLGYLETDVVRLTGLTEQQKKAYILVHNQLTLNTGFDPEKLREEIEAIDTIDLADFNLEIPALKSEEEPEEPLPPAGQELVSFVLTLSEDQYNDLMEAVDRAKTVAPEPHSFGNPNKRNNSIFEVIYQWAERRTLL